MLEDLMRLLSELTGDDPVTNMRRRALIAQIEEIQKRRYS